MDYGAAIVPIDIPDKVGHSKKGWDPILPAFMPANNLTVRASYEVNSYTITFIFNNGEDPLVNELDYGSSISVPDNPSRTGYTFTGWDAQIPDTVHDSDLVFSAVWQVNRHTVTFLNGYGGTICSSVQDYGSIITVPDNPIRTGYTFIRWDSEPPSVLPDRDVTITAVWSVNSYTISFNSAGGSTVGSITAPYGTELQRPSDPYLTGYTFDGWSSPFPETMPANDLLLTAVWRINSYTITFDSAGGSAVSSITAYYGTLISAPANPTRIGYRFLGWDSDIPSNMPARDMTIAARWSINQYTITFNTADGSEIAPLTQDYDTPVSMARVPVRTGYTFTGWSPSIPARMPAENVTVVAQWSINRYTITFTNTGDSSIDPITADYGSEITAPQRPSRTGYSFAGWSVAVPSTMPASDMTVSAVWSINQYTITFDSAGGSSVPQIMQDYNTDITAPQNPTRTGYTFTGWSSPVPLKMPAQNLSLVAQWRINQYTITFDTAGGSEIESITADYGSSVASPPQPSRIGYTFAGWSVPVPSVMPAGDTTVTARWTINQYSVVFDSAGGSSVSSITQDYNTDIIPPQNPTRTGYTFTGWSSPVPSRMPAHDSTITAQWTINQYTITFDSAGGSPVDSITADYNTDVAAPQNPVRNGYTFDCWDISVPVKMPARDMTITAQWRINRYTITFDSAGGSAVPQIRQDYNTDITVPQDPLRTGYTFTGWSSDIPAKMPASNVIITATWSINQYTITFLGTGDSRIPSVTQDYNTDVAAPELPVRTGYTFLQWDTAIPAKMPASNLTVTAQWRINQYTISFDTAGGSAVDSITADYGSAIPRVPDPQRTGYTFSGWSAQIPSAMPASDLTVTAGWTVNRYTISFDSNGGSDVLSRTGDYGSPVPEVQAPSRTGYTFLGWSQSVPRTYPAEDLVLTALWSINQYTISFDTAGGSPVPAVRQDYGTHVASPSNPVRTGYTFLGWSSQIPETIPANDLRITARWSINQYTISFADTGDSRISSITQDYGSDVIAPEQPLRTGYTFLQWDRAIPGKMPAQDTVVTALWRINQYTISFDSSGGSSVDSITANYGTAIQPVNDPVRTGYTFMGWNVPVPRNMPASDLSLTAQWRINQYTITFDSNGGSDVRSVRGDYGSAVPSVAVPVREGYTFRGWSQSIPSVFPASDLALTALWSINQYTISFDSAGGSAVESITADFGTRVRGIPDPVRTGYTFTGWDREIPETVPSADILIRAQWRINQYTISFDSKGGSAVSAVRGDYGSDVPDIAVPVREGYTFRGWSQAIPATFPASDLILSAAWSVNRYTISFDTAGGSSLQDITQDYGTAVTAPPQPLRDGYTFDGWSSQIPETMPAGDLRITAQWRINQYTISFDSAGGTSVESIVQDFGTSVTPPAVPERTGYRFVRWSSEIPAVMPSHDTALTAVWRVNTYTITFDSAGGTQVSPITQDYGTAIAAPSNPVKEGYTFRSWSEPIPETMPAGNMNVTAVWSVNRYIISFDSAGGSQVQSITQDFGTSVTVPWQPVREGYTFLGWSSAIPSKMPAHDTNLTATWRINQYTISFDTGNGSPVSPVIQDYGTAIAAPADPVLTGHTFLGWNPSIPERMPSSDTSVTAVWRINQYTISFDSAGGEPVQSITENYGTRITPPSNPVREGYTFRSWSSEIPASMPAYDLRITASWTVNRYTISFDTDGGNAIGERTFEYGSATVRPDDPVREGYTFTRWNHEFPETMPARDVVLKAEWAINVYSLVFIDRGTEHSQQVQYMGTVKVPALVNNGHTLSWDVPVAETMPDHDLVYNAIWTPNVHTVRFFDGPSQISSATLTYGSVITYPELSRTGYTAVWDRVLDSVPDEDLTLTASWRVNVYSLRIVNQDDVQESQREYCSRISAPDPGERDGFYFAGWSVPIPETMPDCDLETYAVWKATVKSGTGNDAGTFMVRTGNSVTVSSSDIHEFYRPTFAVDGSWSVSVDSRNFGDSGNVSVSMRQLPYNPMGSVCDDAECIYELKVTDGTRSVERTEGTMTVSVPFHVPEGKDVVVWVMAGGDPVRTDSEYGEETLSFSTSYATYWAAAYVDAEEETFPLSYVFGITGIGIIGAAAAAVCIVRRIRSV